MMFKAVALVVVIIVVVIVVVVFSGPVVTVVGMPRVSTLVTFSVIVSTWHVVIFVISLSASMLPVRFIFADCWATIAGTIGFGVGPIRSMSVELGVAFEKLLCFTIVGMLLGVQAEALRVKVAMTPACLDFLHISLFLVRSIV
jgi:uncharacterized protein YebE (UPF0316 family)